MTRSEAVKSFIIKSVLPVATALLLYCIFKSACMKGGSLGGGITLFALNFILAGIIGGFVLAWRLIVAAWYVPLTVWRLIVG